MHNNIIKPYQCRSTYVALNIVCSWLASRFHAPKPVVVLVSMGCTTVTWPGECGGCDLCLTTRTADDGKLRSRSETNNSDTTSNRETSDVSAMNFQIRSEFMRPNRCRVISDCNNIRQYPVASLNHFMLSACFQLTMKTIAETVNYRSQWLKYDDIDEWRLIW